MNTEELHVRITNKGKHPLPSYATEHSAGMDLRAAVPEDLSRRYQEKMDDLRRYWRERLLEDGGSSSPV